MWKHVLLSIVCSVTFLSCDNELHMLFPEGPAGKSAYEVWVEEVLNGTIDWPEDRTDVNNFFLYLKGEDGKPGDDGQMPDITIGENGNWYINGEDTGVPAQGKDGNNGDDGQPGANGQSAYELWVEEVKAGRVYKNGELWPTTRTTVADFWEFLRGNDGADGEPGQDGQDGATIVLGAPNVIIQYYGDPDLKEYVDWEDGSVTYKIYDASGKVAEAGTQVKGIPDSKSVYTVDDEGFITVPKGDLPKDKAYENIAVEVKIDGEADFKSSATNTIVPAKMQVRLVINEEKTPTVGLFGTGEDQAKPCVNLWFKVQRKKLNTSGSGSWEGIPAALGNTQKTVKIYEYKDGVSNPTTVATHTQIEVADDGTGHNYGNCRVQIKRKFIYTDLKYLDKTKVADSDDYWGEYSAGAFRYARIGIEGCYGEAIMLQSYIKLLPAQFTPTISEMTRSELYGDGSTGGVDDLVNLTGTLDVSKVKKELFLASEYKKASKVGGLDVYEPVVGKIDEAGEIFKINFSSSTTSTNIIQLKVTIDGAFTARAVNYQSTVDLTNNSLANFYNLSLGNISGASGTLYLRVNGTYVTAPAGSENGIEIKVSSN